MADPLQQQQPPEGLTATQLEMLNNVEEFRRAAGTPTPSTNYFHSSSTPSSPVAARPVPPRSIPPDSQPGPTRLEHVNAALLETAQAVSRIVATRFLLLIAVVTASAVWGVVVYAPTQLGIIAAGVYSVVGMWPLVFLYLRRG